MSLKNYVSGGYDFAWSCVLETKYTKHYGVNFHIVVVSFIMRFNRSDKK